MRRVPRVVQAALIALGLASLWPPSPIVVGQVPSPPILIVANNTTANPLGGFLRADPARRGHQLLCDDHARCRDLGHDDARQLSPGGARRNRSDRGAGGAVHELRRRRRPADCHAARLRPLRRARHHHANRNVGEPPVLGLPLGDGGAVWPRRRPAGDDAAVPRAGLALRAGRWHLGGGDDERRGCRWLPGGDPARAAPRPGRSTSPRAWPTCARAIRSTRTRSATGSRSIAPTTSSTSGSTSSASTCPTPTCTCGCSSASSTPCSPTACRCRGSGYFPGTSRTLMVVTGDSHTSLLPPHTGLLASVENFGARISLYLSRYGTIAATTVSGWISRGHEVGLHPGLRS